MFYTTKRVSTKSIERFTPAILNSFFLRYSFSVSIEVNNLIHSLLQFPAVFRLPYINWKYHTVAIFVTVDI
jgi:hypothetical protein